MIMLQATSASASSGIGLTLSYVFFLLLLTLMALISAAEVNLIGLENKDEKEVSDVSISDQMRKIIDSPRQLLVTILLTHTILSVSLIILGSYILDAWISNDYYNQMALTIQGITGIYYGTTILSTVTKASLLILSIVIIGETIPKLYATLNQNLAVVPSASLLYIFHTIFSPLSKGIVRLSDKFEKNNNHNLKGHAREEIDAAIDLTMTNNDEKTVKSADLLKGIVNFGDKSVSQIMQPKVDIIGLDASMGFKQVLRIVKEYSYSRLPVWNQKSDKISGIVYIKDLLQHINQVDDFRWQDLIRQTTLYVSSDNKIDELLKEFQKRRAHMAIVVDEEGSTIGLVTLEDIMEEIVGEIKDEYDTDEQPEHNRISDNQYIFSGRTMIRDVCKVLNEIPTYFDSYSGDADSLAGLVLEQLGSIPNSDGHLLLNDYLIKVVSHTNRRIDKISITKQS
jgi:putative hemolysin